MGEPAEGSLPNERFARFVVADVQRTTYNKPTGRSTKPPVLAHCYHFGDGVLVPVGRLLAPSLPRGGSSWVARFKGIVVDDDRPVASPLGAFSSSLIHTIGIATPVSLGAFVVALLFIPVVRGEAGTDTSLSM